jgi:hypothetical protein
MMRVDMEVVVAGVEVLLDKVKGEKIQSCGEYPEHTVRVVHGQTFREEMEVPTPVVAVAGVLITMEITKEEMVEVVS